MKDFEDLENATKMHSRLSVDLDKFLEAEKNAELALLEKEKEVRKDLFIRVEGGEMTMSHFKELLKDKTFTQMVEYKKARIMRKIGENKLNAAREILNTVKKQISIN